jgi:hypothetical protein
VDALYGVLDACYHLFVRSDPFQILMLMLTEVEKPTQSRAVRVSEGSSSVAAVELRPRTAYLLRLSR